MKARKSPPKVPIVKILRTTAAALMLAVLCCFWSGPVMAQTYDTNLIIGNTGNESYSNDGSTGSHYIDGNLILGHKSTGNGSYTITGDSSQTNVNFVSGGNGGYSNGALIVGRNGTGSFTQGTDMATDNNNQVNVAGDLVLGRRSGGVGSYTLNSGTLTVGGQLAVGGQGTGTFTQNGGAVNLTNTASGNPGDYVPVGGLGFAPWGGALAVGGGIGNGDGSNSGGTGTYNLYGGTINTYNLLIGPTGNGTMTQSGGQVTTTYFTAGFTGNGTYNLGGSTSSLYVQGEQTVGSYGTGSFNQSGGVNTVGTALYLGSNGGGQGTYNLTGGTLTTGQNDYSGDPLSRGTNVGYGGTGTFTISNADGPSTHAVNGNLILGGQAGGSGTYTITGDTSQTTVNFAPGVVNRADGMNPNGALIIGEYGAGNFTQGNGSDNPTVAVAGDLVLGHQGLGWGGSSPNSIGTYTINSGTLTVGGNIGVGGASTATDGLGNPLNVFTQTGGTVTLTGSASGSSDYIGVGTNDHIGSLYIGGAAGANNDGGAGAYIMTGGVLNVNNGVIEVGHSGLGIMTQSGDSTVNTQAIWLGNAGGSNGTYTLTGGTINAGNVIVGMYGNGTFNQSGGSNAISGMLNIGFQSGQGTYNLSGTGVLTAGRIIVGDGTGDGGDPAFWGYNGAGGVLNISENTSLTTGEMRIGVLNQGIVNQSGGTVIVNGNLTLGEIGTVPNASGYYNLTGTGQLNVNGDAIVGVAGYGKITQGTVGDGGLTNAAIGGSLILGAGDNISPNEGPQPRAGEYVLNSGTLSTGSTIVGSAGVGTFTQNGGVHTTGQLILGDQTRPFDYTACEGKCISGGPSFGTYNMKDGILITSNTFVGNQGTGVFNQFGGIHYVGVNPDKTVQDGLHELIVGRFEGSSGTYNLSGGELHAAREIIGDAGYTASSTGVFNQSGGSVHVVYNDLIIGQDAMSKGTFTLADTALLTVKGNVFLGDEGGTGLFKQTGGSHTITGSLIIGTNSEGGTAAGNGKYVLSGDEVTSTLTAGYINVGNTGKGRFVQDGGTVTVTGGFGALILGSQDSGEGLYKLKNGVLNVAFEEYIGNWGKGTFIQTGGTHNLEGAMYVGLESGSYGEYTMSGGTLTATDHITMGAGIGSTGVFNLSNTANVTAGYVHVGRHGQGTFNQSGGTLNAGWVTIAQGPTGKGTYNLSGGTLNANDVINNDRLNYSGGNLNANVQNSNTGVIQLSGSGTRTVNGNIENAGTVRLASGTDAVVTGAYNQTAGLTDVNGTLTAALLQIRGGLLTGSGTIYGNVANSGMVNPGNSPGILTISGNYEQTAVGALLVELGGTARGTEHDVLDVTGNAILAGKLIIQLYGGYNPLAGTYFDILTASSISGKFDSVAGPSGWNWTIAYLDLNGDSYFDTARITANSVPVPAAVWLLGSGLIGLLGFRRKFFK